MVGIVLWIYIHFMQNLVHIEIYIYSLYFTQESIVNCGICFYRLRTHAFYIFQCGCSDGHRWESERKEDCIKIEPIICNVTCPIVNATTAVTTTLDVLTTINLAPTDSSQFNCRKYHSINIILANVRISVQSRNCIVCNSSR